MQPTTRRRFLGSLGGPAALGLAGCTGTTQLDDLKSRLNAANEREQRLEKELAKTRAELNETQHDLDQVETQNDNLRTQLHHERQETQTLQTQLDSKNESITTLETRITKKEQRITELESLIAAEGAQYGFAQETVAQARSLGNELQKSVVNVSTYSNGRKNQAGTGWHMGDGYYLTNSHVVETGDAYKLQLFDESAANTKTVDATLLGMADSNTADIALLKSSATSPPALNYATSTNLNEGDPLVHVGHPLGVGGWVIGLGPFANYGRGFTDANNTATIFQSYLPSRSGNSGSPVATLDGTIVGMTFSSTGSQDNPRHAPDNVHTHFAEYPLLQNHLHCNVFDLYINNWK